MINTLPGEGGFCPGSPPPLFQGRWQWGSPGMEQGASSQVLDSQSGCSKVPNGEPPSAGSTGVTAGPLFSSGGSPAPRLLLHECPKGRFGLWALRKAGISQNSRSSRKRKETRGKGEREAPCARMLKKDLALCNVNNRAGGRWRQIFVLQCPEQRRKERSLFR